MIKLSSACMNGLAQCGTIEQMMLQLCRATEQPSPTLTDYNAEIAKTIAILISCILNRIAITLFERGTDHENHPTYTLKPLLLSPCNTLKLESK